MKTFTKYHRASGAIVGQRIVPDDVDPGAGTAEIGLLEGSADPETQYVENGAIATRTRPTGLSVDKTSIAADGSDAATITGLPNPSWLRVNGAFVQSSGTLQITSADPGPVRVELVGAYVQNPLVIEARDQIGYAFEADPRWQALKSATPDQIDTWLAANMTNLAQARSVFKMLLLAVRKLIKE